MELTKYTHSSVRMEHDGHVLVFDPGNFAPEGEHAQLLELLALRFLEQLNEEVQQPV